MKIKIGDKIHEGEPVDMMYQMKEKIEYFKNKTDAEYLAFWAQQVGGKLDPELTIAENAHNLIIFTCKKGHGEILEQ